MPRFHDPALRTPERIRAASSMWRFGGAILLFIPAIFGHFVVWAGSSPHAWNWEWIATTGVHIDYLIVLLPMPTVVGVLAIMAGIGICKRRWWSRGVWWAATSIFAVAIFPYLVIVNLKLKYVPSQTFAAVFASMIILIFITWFVLYGIALDRYNQFRKSERIRK